MTEHWTDRIVGDRMAVDQAFTDRVTSSQFSRQQWGLIMTAIEFEIENPDDEATARLVADTSDLPAVMSELEDMEPAGPMGMDGGPGGRGGGGSSSGLLGSLANRLLGGGSDRESDGGDSGSDDIPDDQIEAARQLVQEYASELQAHLEEQDRWAEVRAAAAGDQ